MDMQEECEKCGVERLIRRLVEMQSDNRGYSLQILEER